MSVYSLDKLISQARKLAAEYKKTTGKTLPGVSNEIAEYDAARLLGLELSDDRSKGFDAVGRGRLEGKKIQIKGRTIFDENKTRQRIGQIKIDKEWDLLVLILLDAAYHPYEIYQAEREEIMTVIDTLSTSQKKRGALSVARIRIIGKLVWTREDGLEPEIWDNHKA